MGSGVLNRAPPPTDDNPHAGSRKLACSKEPDGCARCKREGIVCHYSPQKQMGRPRKRPRDESAAAATTGDVTPTESTSKSPMMDLPPDTEDPGMAFINMLTSGDLEFDWANTALLHEELALEPPQHQQLPAEKASSNNHNWAAFGFTGNDFGQLNFDAAGPEHAPTFSSLDIDPALFGGGGDTTSASASAGASPETPAVPGLVPTGSSNTPSSSVESPGNCGATTMATIASGQCACTSKLFSAIDSMRSLPSEVGVAVRQARLASKTAYEVVNCPSCSIPSTRPFGSDHAGHAATDSLRGFQTLMLLATLIPSVVSAYERIIHMVDQEASRAASERRELAFTLPGYGGIWGSMAANDSCGASSALGHRLMEPPMWRLTVRALLRVDVYGISGSCGDSGSGMSDPFHLGLRDIVTMMENQSRARHAVMDPLIQSGAWEDVQCALKLHKTGETPTCQKIIQIAKMAVDNLVIA